MENIVLKDVNWQAELEGIPPTAGDVKAPEEFGDEAWEYMTGMNEKRGVTTPWQHFDFRFQPATFNIFMGQSGSGKSQITQQIALHAVRDQAATVPQKVLIWSAEMPTPAVVSTFGKLACGLEKPTREYFDKAIEWMGDRIWVYQRNHKVTMDELIGISLFAQRELGVTMVIVDSLVKIHSGANAANFLMVQTDMADRFAVTARDTGLTFLLVAHARKAETEKSRIDKFSLKGSGGISDMASTVFAVNRNITKSEVLKGMKGKRTDDEVQDVLGQPDCFLECLKNREGGDMPAISLWFNAAGQFVDKPDKMIRIPEIESGLT